MLHLPTTFEVRKLSRSVDNYDTLSALIGGDLVTLRLVHVIGRDVNNLPDNVVVSETFCSRLLWVNICLM